MKKVLGVLAVALILIGAGAFLFGNKAEDGGTYDGGFCSNPKTNIFVICDQY